MTRRRSSVAEDIAEITSRMPWWVGVVLVAVMTKGLATGGQYVLPIIFLLGSLVSGLRRLRAAPLRELYGVMAARGAAGGFVVTSGRFTDDARAFSNGRNLTLIEGAQLHQMIHAAKAAHTSRAPDVVVEPREPAGVPSCPRCGSAMLRREARKGAQAGQLFWGCPKFPECRGTRPIS